MNWTAQHRTAASDLERLSAARWLGYWRLGGGAIGDAAAVGHRLSAPSAIGGLAVGGLAVGGHWQLGSRMERPPLRWGQKRIVKRKAHLHARGDGGFRSL